MCSDCCAGSWGAEMDLLPWLTVVLPAIALSLTVFNLVVWPRGTRRRVTNRVSVLIPARNEEDTIEATVRSALAQEVFEVVVYDDQSTDATPDILARIGAEDNRLRVLEGKSLPAGWVGKPHACHRLSEAARGDVFLFLDADVTLRADALERIGGIFGDYEADVVTAVPHQEVEGFVERLVLPLLHLTYVSWLPLPLIWRTRDPRFLAANGQVLAVTRAAYQTVGGFEAVRDAVVDDMAFCAEQKRAGRRVVFADGHDIASCRMYESAGEVWRGFSKNIFEGIGSVVGLIFVLALYLSAFVWPWIALGVGGALLVPGAIAVALNVVQRILLAVRHGHAPEGIVLNPLAVLVLCAIAVNSWLWHLRGNIQWAGRSYARKEARGG